MSFSTQIESNGKTRILQRVYFNCKQLYYLISKLTFVKILFLHDLFYYYTEIN